MARRPNIRGLIRVRRLLKRLPDAVSGEMIVELNVTGRQMVAAVQARTPSRTGALRTGETFKVFPKTLRLQVGLLATRSGQSKLFYGRIQDRGRRAQTVLVQRRKRVSVTLSTGQTLSLLRTGRSGRKLKSDIVSTYKMKVPAMEGKRFITGRYPDLRRTLGENLRGIFMRGLRKAASSGTD